MAPAPAPALHGTHGAAGQDLSLSPTKGRTEDPVGQGAVSAPRRVSQITQQKPALLQPALGRPQTGSAPTPGPWGSRAPCPHPRIPAPPRSLSGGDSRGEKRGHLHPTCGQGAGGSESIAARLGPLPDHRDVFSLFSDLSLKEGGKKEKKAPPKKQKRKRNHGHILP